MADCEQIRPSLYRVIEREAEPAEAMDVASHLSDCTGCKILMARKRRLSHMLEEGLEDRIPVGEEFVRSVMATLPEGPPPRRRNAKRGLKLAGSAGLLFALGQAVSARLPLVGIERPTLGLPSLDVPAGDGGFPGALELLRWTVAILEAVGNRLPLDLALPGTGLAIAATLVGVLLVGFVGSSAAFAVAAGSYLRSRRA